MNIRKTIFATTFLTSLIAVGINVAGAAEDVVTAPPDPICADGDFLWKQNLGIYREQVLLKRGGSTETFTIPPGTYPAEFASEVTLSIDDTVAWDGYVGRSETGINSGPQENERYKFVFFKNGSFAAESGWTGDALDVVDEDGNVVVDGDDGINTGWESDFWRGSLDQDIFLPDGTDEIQIVHWSAPLPPEGYGTADDTTPNSVYPTSVCISSNEPDASLGDYVWEDLNGNGIQDCIDGTGAECTSGVNGVTVELLDPMGADNCDSAELIDTTMTATTADGAGFYSFDGLPPGNYCVSFVKPAGYDCTLSNVGDNDAVDSDGVDNDDPLNPACPVAELIKLDAGENDPTWDLGLVRPLLGDRVWEDLNGNGVQDCFDTNGDGIIGNDDNADEPECGSGIADITVNLFTDCTAQVPVLMDTTMTGADGFYSFGATDGLIIGGTYCVEFELPADAFCNTTINDVTYPLGAPLFTDRNQGLDNADSDADPATGFSETVTLSSDGGGINNLTVDAGIVCPGKIGNRVWLDEDEDGLQVESSDEGVSGAKVELFECGSDGIAGTDDDVDTNEDRFTDANGYYMFGAEPGVYDLAPGSYYVKFSGVDGEFTQMGPDGTDPDDSDCARETGATTCFTVGGSRSVDLTRDCGVVPPPAPECGLTLDKQCRVEAPPSQDFDKCDGKLEQFTLVWAGGGTITATGPSNEVTVSDGGEATFVGPFSDNDVLVSISGAVSGESKFHVSCSDEEFNDPSDCGNSAGDGKGTNSGFINDWLLAGFIDKEGRVLDCTPGSDVDFADECEFVQPPAVSCETTGKPDTLTWRYDDGSCAESTLSVQNDFECSEEGVLDTGAEITLTDDLGGTQQVLPGMEFTVLRDDNQMELSLNNAGGTQYIGLHTSCSQPLETGLTAGALTLVGLNGQTGGVDVTYRYNLENTGDDLTDVVVDDDQFDNVFGRPDLASGGTDSFDVMTRISGTTTNTAQASGSLSNGDSCAPSAAFDSVTIEAVVPPCSIGFKLDKVADDVLKIKLTNNGTTDVRLDELTVGFPVGRELLREVKLDGAIYKRDDSTNPVDDNPATIGLTDWTKDDASKRVLEPGETRTLEIKTTKKSDKNGLFTVTLSFGEGCVYTVTVENQQLSL